MPDTPEERRIATSFFTSNKITSASCPGPVPSSWTVVSSWPATTCAFVTITPSPAIQPEPCTPRPQAVPSTRTTLSPPPAPRDRGRSWSPAAARRGAGPVICGSGSKRASAFRIGPEGGRAAFSRWRISELLDVAREARARPASAARPRRRSTRSRAPGMRAGRPAQAVERPDALRRCVGEGGSRAPRARTRRSRRSPPRRSARRAARTATSPPRRGAAGRRAPPARHRPRSPQATVPRRSAPARSPRKPSQA